MYFWPGVCLCGEIFYLYIICICTLTNILNHNAFFYKTAQILTARYMTSWLSLYKWVIFFFLFFFFFLSLGFGGDKWKTNVLLTALLCPGYVELFCIMRKKWSITRWAFKIDVITLSFTALCLRISSWWIWFCGWRAHLLPSHSQYW